MLRHPVRLLLACGAALLLLLIGGRALASLYTDALWYGSVGYASVFWTRLGAGAAVRLVAGGLAAALVLVNLWAVSRYLGGVQLRRRYGNLEIAEQIPRIYILSGMVLAAVLAGWWLAELKFGGGAALAVIAWLRNVPWGISDPLFGHDLSFYVFSLPVYFQIADFLLLVVIWSAVLVLLGHVLAGSLRVRDGRLEIDDRARLHVVVLAAALVFIIGARYWLGRYGLLLEGSGFREALGYTDVHARLPANRAMALLSLLATGALLYGGWRRTWTPPVLALAAVIFGAFFVGYLYPALVQKFQVEPNQLAKEAPYIRWNLEYTRRAFDLDRMDRRQFAYRPMPVPEWDDLEPVLARLPLWDLDPLLTTYNQKQALFGYYHFPSVNFDRYGPPGAAQQVAIAVREVNRREVPAASRTWQTLRLDPQYMRGIGAVVTPVAERAVQGEPVLWVGNNPVDIHPEAPTDVHLQESSVYFGQTTDEYVVIVPGRDSTLAGSPGADFPAGVSLRSFSRLLAFAWRFGDKNLLFSRELSDDSRLVFRRTVAERIRTLAPFLMWDPAPYPVIYNGRLVWIIDGYTVSRTFPLSRPVELPGTGVPVRFLRSSVKATIDAITGEASLFVLKDGADPILETYRRIFPNLFRTVDEMPPELRHHLRYPALYARAQAAVLEEYHLDRPDRFYAGQDVWQVPQGVGVDRSFRPAYALMRLPGEARAEFLLTIPFIARGRQNMTALLVARNDPPHYGELVLLELPRDQQIPGPRQVETLIEQDPVISQQLAFWRQSGSDVNFGNLRVIPLDSTFVFVEPLFLSAPGNPIPQLTRVIVSDGRSVSMAPSMAEAVAALSDEARGGARRAARDLEPLPVVTDWPRRALELLEEAEVRLRNGDFAGFGTSWAELRDLLRGATRGLQ